MTDSPVLPIPITSILNTITNTNTATTINTNNTTTTTIIMSQVFVVVVVAANIIRDFKQIATATSTTAVVDAESWGEYVTVARQISNLSKLGPNSDYGVSYSLAFAIIY